MKYCAKCLMPDTRPGIKLDEKNICTGCLNFEKQKSTDWDKRFDEFKKLCDKYRGCNGNGYDCAIAVSGGKDSHFQTYYLKEVIICLKRLVVILSCFNQIGKLQEKCLERHLKKLVHHHGI